MQSANPRRWAALGLIALAQFMVIMDTSIIGVALPEIRTDLGFGAGDLSWVFNAYVIAFGGLLLLGGRLSDLLGARRVFAAGWAILAGASLVAGLAETSGVEIAARAAQGAGAALIAPSALTLLMMLFGSNPKELMKAFAVYGAAAPAGGTAGVFLGGVITEWISWPWVFYVNIPIAIAVLAAIPALLPAAPARRGSIDVGGALAATAGLALTVFGVVRAPEEGWGSAATLGAIAGGIALLAAFVAIQAARREPLMRLGILRTPNLAAANLAQVLLGAAWIPMWFFLNLYLQQVLGYGAFEGGAALLPMTAAIMLLMVVVAPRVVNRLGFKTPIVLGMLLLATGMAILSLVRPDGSFVVDVLPASLIAAAGMALAFIPSLGTAISSAKPEEGGLASGIVNTSYQVGSALGLAAMTALASAQGADRLGDVTSLTDGYSAAFLGAAGIAVAGAALAAALLRTPKRVDRPRSTPSRACKEPDMSFFSSKRSASRMPHPLGSRLGPQRLAEFATRRPRRVLAVWGVVVLVSLGLTGTLLGSGLTSDSSLTNHPESAKAQDLIDARLRGQSAVDEVIVVRSERSVVTDPAFATHVRGLVAQARRSGAVTQISSYLDRGGEQLISADQHATVLPVVVAHPQEDRIADLISLVERSDGSEGFAAHITGTNTLDRDFTELSASDLSKGELQFGLPAALIVLLLVVGTLVGVAIPMLMAIISIIVALGITAVVGQAFELNLFILNMIVAMGLALGIDYSLFIVSRLREERHRGSGTREAILTVANTATRAVVFSGTAFALAMIAMLLVPDTTLRSLGLGAVIVGLVSIVVALTFHPAILMVLGDRVDRLRVPWLGRRVAASAGEEGPLWRRAVLAVMRRPAISLVATTAVLLALAFPVLGLQLGAAGTSSLPDDTVAKQGLLALERDFPSGATEPVTVVLDGSPDDAGAQQGFARLRAELGSDRDFAARALTIETGPRVAVASVPLTVEPSSGRGSAAIDRLRDDYVPAAFGAAANRVFVGGTPAEAHDSFAVNRSWLPIVIAFVLTLSFVLLTLAFRSIAIPLTAIAVNLLSVGAAYGILVLVFQEGVGADLLGFTQVERIDAWVPIFLFSVLFGLSMDYQVFLLSRIHERWAATGDTPEAIVHGVASTARLITGAAAIIIVVFSGFATGQLVAFQEMGFGIAIALALDATLVRLLLIPAAMRLLGERNWYLPGWLSWLPNVQVEGPQPAPLRPAVLVRQYTGDAVPAETAPAPPDPPVATSKES